MPATALSVPEPSGSRRIVEVVAEHTVLQLHVVERGVVRPSIIALVKSAARALTFPATMRFVAC